jgi:hypothetical protein
MVDFDFSGQCWGVGLGCCFVFGAFLWNAVCFDFFCWRRSSILVGFVPCRVLFGLVKWFLSLVCVVCGFGGFWGLLGFGCF